MRAFGCDDRGQLERVGFYACTRDLEDELTRAVGPDGMERVLVEQGELRAFRTYQKQPAHRALPLEEQLHGFMWNRKQKYAVLLVEALDLESVPRPLDPCLDALLAQRTRGTHALATEGRTITFSRRTVSVAGQEVANLLAVATGSKSNRRPGPHRRYLESPR